MPLNFVSKRFCEQPLPPGSLPLPVIFFESAISDRGGQLSKNRQKSENLTIPKAKT